MKKLLSVILGLCFLTMVFSQSFGVASEIKIYVNGKRLNSPVKLTIVKGQPIIQPDAVFKTTGVSFKWDAKSRILTGKRENNSFSIVAPGNTVIVNGKQVKLNEKAIVIKNCILVPLSFFSKVLHYNAYYDSKNAFIKLESPKIQVTKKFAVISSALKDKGKIPLKYTYIENTGAKNVSIPLKWSNAPAGTKSYAILMVDKHPMAEGFIHWAVVNIPAAVQGLTEGVSKSVKMPKGAIELQNNYNEIGYGGPQPPAGSGDHEYKIIIYALSQEKLMDMDKKIIAPEGYADSKRFVSNLEGKVLAKAELTGYFGR